MDTFYLMTQFAEPILFTLVTYYFDKEHFITRYIKLVLFLAVVSLVFYVWGLADSAGLIHSGLLKEVEGLRITYTKYYCNIFYALRPVELQRNVGMFCEPGLYQIILNSGIYLLIFYPNRIDMKHKTITMLILLITSLTTLSATGIIGVIILIIGLLFSKNESVKSNIKIVFILLLSIAVVYLFVDFAIKGSHSLIYTSLLGKIAGIKTSQLTTGSVRILTIAWCLYLIFHNPLGYGLTYVNNFFASKGEYFVGAKILMTTAEVGVIPMFLIVRYFFEKAYKNRISNLQFYILVFLFLNTALAQSREFYPALLMLLLL
ncbi:hypothetical protein [Diplocloster hominis]|uniref:hypothetical protein n=1 Tax=Diplocloster hominis TaxID=3079010 RepID=UPI0031BA2A8F